MKRKITFLIAAMVLLTMMASTGTLCATDYSYTFTAKVYDKAGAQTLNNVSWTMAGTGGSYFGYDGTKGQQFGSGSKPYSALSLTTSGISGTITSVVINTSGASSINATVAISVGSTDFTCSGNTTASLTESATSYTFTGSASGNITISWAQTSSKAIYIKSITVTYSVGATYTVTYNANGGTVGTVPTDATSYANGATVTVKNRNTLDYSSTSPDKGFKGWNTQADGLGIFYHPGATFTMGSSNVNLYAVWTTRCAFAYDDNGADDGDVPDSYYTSYGTGAKVVVLGNTGELEKDAAVWEGWNTADDGSGDTYQEGDSFIIESDVTLYAKWRELATYTLVTSIGDIEPGKHYIIASSKTNGEAYAIGYQKSSNRNAVSVSVSSSTITEVDNLYEFVISGNSGSYTIYDKNINKLNETNPNKGYLAPTGAKNTVKLESTYTNKGQWTITIADDIATFASNGESTYKYLRFNNGSSLFSCYESGKQDNVYLYKKADDAEIEYYSPTTINLSLNITTPTTVGKGGVLDMGSNALSISGDGSLTIEDGGQLITSSAVSATIEKNITAASKDIADHWYTIASSVNAPTFVSVTNLTDDEEYDLYRYDESSFTWQNSKKDMGGGVQQFTAFENGRGYLYRKAGSETIKYVGTINTGDLENYSLSWASTNNDLKGLNLIGNPFPHNIYKGYGGAIDDAKLSDKFYYLENNGTWQVGTYTTAIKPGMGIIVQTNSAGDITIKDNATPATAEHDPAKANNDEIMLTVSNSQHQDVAYAVFGDRYGLKKIEHRSADAPMLYIPQNNRRYAVAMMSDDTKSFNLNFKAMTIGSYTLSYKSKGDFDYVHVIDCLTGEDIDMLQGEYSFIATPGDNENRFIVRLGYMPNNEGTENEIFAYQNGNNILVSGEGELQVFDVTGRMVVTQHVNGVETINVQSQGVYIFKLNEKVQKIVVR